MVFIDLEKAYDKMPRDLIWWVLTKSNVPKGYIKIIKGINERSDNECGNYLWRDR